MQMHAVQFDERTLHYMLGKLAKKSTHLQHYKWVQISVLAFQTEVRKHILLQAVLS